MDTLENQSVLLVGLGESGLACARWVLAQGARLVVVDSRERPPGLASLQMQYPQVQCHESVDQLPWLFDRVVLSPGLPPSHGLMQAVLDKAQAHNVQVDSELDLFADALACLKVTHAYSPKVVSITGTNGKTTTTNMVVCLASFSGKNAIAAGNISPAALDALQQALAQNALPDVWVLELSSFQLHWTTRLHSHASVVLNVTQDHLDWHGKMDDYARDKFRVYSAESVCVVNRDDTWVNQAVMPVGAVSVGFGLSAPTRQGDFGLVREGGMLWLAQAYEVQEQRIGRRAKQEAVEVSLKLLMPADALQVVGLHNASNALAALALCSGIDLPMAKLLHGLRNYQGEPHRVEHVLQIEGVDYVDDSKGTNVGATVAALKGLARSVILIAGGEGKGQDFTVLGEAVARHCKHVLLIGKDAPCIAEVVKQAGIPYSYMDSLDACVRHAYGLACVGDCVLLSPACASFDMFKDYAHRADVFVLAVRGLATERGKPC